MTWNLKKGSAVERRLETLRKKEIVINTSTHEGRQVIGYCYFEHPSTITQIG